MIAPLLALPWLLEAAEPGPRYLALRDVVRLAPDEPELLEARRLAHTTGPIAGILAEMHSDGYWVAPGPGYNPKYRSTVWALSLLAQLGAHITADERIRRAISYFLDQALAPGGQISASGAPSGTADCLQGNLCWALVALGCEDPRLENAYEWMARSVTGEGIAPNTERDAPLRYYAGKCGPNFACGANDRQPCAWGAVKVLLALGRWPKDRRTPLMERATQRGVDFLLNVNPAEAEYPHPYAKAPSGNWWKFGFPVFYITDMLQIVEAIVGIGYGDDPRLENAWKVIKEKQDSQGRWPLEYDYAGKTWGDYGRKKVPNKWVTIRALRALQATN
jgi:hypothetical protein